MISMQWKEVKVSTSGSVPGTSVRGSYPQVKSVMNQLTSAPGNKDCAWTQNRSKPLALRNHHQYGHLRFLTTHRKKRKMKETIDAGKVCFCTLVRLDVQGLSAFNASGKGNTQQHLRLRAKTRTRLSPCIRLFKLRRKISATRGWQGPGQKGLDVLPACATSEGLAAACACSASDFDVLRMFSTPSHGGHTEHIERPTLAASFGVSTRTERHALLTSWQRTSSA